MYLTLYMIVQTWLDFNDNGFRHAVEYDNEYIFF